MDTDAKTTKKKRAPRVQAVTADTIRDVLSAAQKALNRITQLKDEIEAAGWTGGFEFDGGGTGVRAARELTEWVGVCVGKFDALPVADKQPPTAPVSRIAPVGDGSKSPKKKK